MDRVDLTQYLPNPCARATYEILRSSLNELIRCRIITVQETSGNAKGDEDVNSGGQGATAGPECHSIATFAEMNVRFYNLPNSPSRMLWDIVSRCEGFSGRSLRRIPVLAVALYTHGQSCSIEEALAAVSLAVNDENMKSRHGKS